MTMKQTRRDTPAEPFLYHDFEDALRCLREALTTAPAYCLLLGDSGTGKTTLLRTLQARLDLRRFQIVYLCHGQPTPSGLTRLLTERLHLPVRRTRMEASPLLVQTLRNLPTRLVVWIDEAQTIHDDTLHEIRMLSEADLDGPPLFSVLLSALPDFKNRLLSPPLFPLWRRLSPRVTLNGLQQEELIPFLGHVLGKKPAARFSPEALLNAFEVFHGIPALMQSFAAECIKTYPEGDITAELAADVLDRLYGR
jgi:type II secretory pathway predicted ATPase ExeA